MHQHVRLDSNTASIRVNCWTDQAFLFFSFLFALLLSFDTLRSKSYSAWLLLVCVLVDDLFQLGTTYPWHRSRHMSACPTEHSILLPPSPLSLCPSSHLTLFSDLIFTTHLYFHTPSQPQQQTTISNGLCVDGLLPLPCGIDCLINNNNSTTRASPVSWIQRSTT